MLRPVDLARAAGISTQQVRNYIDEGILPPAERTAAGYRKLDERHRLALDTCRALARGFGWPAARAILSAVHAGDRAEALTLIDAGHAALHEQRQSLRTVGVALEAVATQPVTTTTIPRTGLRIGEAAAHLRVRASALRVWEAAGLLRPRRDPGTGYRTFSSGDVRDARMIKMLRQGAYPLPQIRPILDGLRETGSSDALRAAIERRHTSLTERAGAMLEGASHLHAYLTATGS